MSATSSKPKLSAKDMATNFADACRKHVFTWSAKSNVVKIHKRFTPGDRDAYVDCDMIAYDILSHVPLKGGSIWGTDGGSVGGMAGLNGGYYTLNKSGNGAKRFLSALAKLC